MKPKSTLHAFLSVVSSSLLAISLASAQTTYTWDINAAAGVTGGAGAWNTSNTLWTTDTGATNTSWVNAGAAPFNNAVFGGTTGTVTLGEAISIRNLNFTNTAGAYTITGSTLNFTGGTITGPISSTTESAIIQSNITGAPAIDLTLMAGDRQFTLRPVTNGSMVIGAVSGDGGDGSQKINLQGDSGSTGTITSVTGTKVIATAGSWTLNNASNGRDHLISGGTLTLKANLNATKRAVILSGTGVLNYNVTNAVTASAATNISTDNGFRITGGTLDNTSGAAINTNASTQSIDLAGTLTFAGSGGANSNLHLGSGAVFLKGGNRQITVTNSATTLTIGGVIQNDSVGARGLTKAGAGTLSLSGSGANTYNGTTTINGGILALGKTAGVNAIAGAITLGDGATTAGNDILRLNASNQIADTAVINFNAATGANAGILRLNNQSETVAGIASTGGGGIIENESGSAATSTLTVNNAANHSFSGIIRDGDSSGTDGTLALTKTGSGTLTLTNTNTYTGATNINAGTLAITGTGTINSSSSISIAAGGTLRYNSSTALTVAPTLAGAGIPNRAVLGGTGPINVAITLDDLGDVLSPGNSPGIQNYTVDQTWSSFSYDWEVNNFTGTAAGTDFDQITGTAFTLGSGPGSYILNVIGLDAGNVAGLTPNFSEIDRTWTILTSSGTSTFNAANWTINTAGFTNPNTGTWALGQTGNNLVLSYTVIPEPRSALLWSFGLLALLRRRRY